MSKIFDVVLEKYRLFLLQRQQSSLLNGKCFFFSQVRLRQFTFSVLLHVA